MSGSARAWTLGLLSVMAWRNLWRNTNRTSLTAGTISLGLALLLISLGLGTGGDRQMLDGAVRMVGAHLAVEAPGYDATRSLDLTVRIERMPDIVAPLGGHGLGTVTVLPRLYASGLASSADGASGVSIIGFDHLREAPVSAIDDRMVAGSYFGAAAATAAVIGEGVARKLALTPGAKFVLMAQGSGSGDIQSLLVRVAGITRTGVEDVDQSAVFLPLTVAQSLTGLEGQAHQIALILGNVEETEQAATLLAAALPHVAVLTWSQLMPSQRDLIRVNVAGRILVDIAFFMIIAFLVMNTLLMSVVERRREFALLDAVGLTPRRRLLLVLIEATWVAALATVVGAAVGIAGHLYFARYGLPLRLLSPSGMSAAGATLAPVLYSALSAAQVLVTSGLVFIMTVVLALVPAWKAATAADAHLLR